MQYVDCKWNQCLKKLGNGEIDMMPDVAINPARQKLLIFTVFQSPTAGPVSGLNRLCR